MTHLARCGACGYPKLVDPLSMLCEGCQNKVRIGGSVMKGLGQPAMEEEEREAWFARKERERRRAE